MAKDSQNAANVEANMRLMSMVRLALRRIPNGSESRTPGQKEAVTTPSFLLPVVPVNDKRITTICKISIR